MREKTKSYQEAKEAKYLYATTGKKVFKERYEKASAKYKKAGGKRKISLF